MHVVDFSRLIRVVFHVSPRLPHRSVVSVSSRRSRAAFVKVRFMATLSPWWSNPCVLSDIVIEDV